jgi:hypothetical protein
VIRIIIMLLIFVCGTTYGSAATHKKTSRAEHAQATPPKRKPVANVNLDILPESPASSGVRIFKGTWSALEPDGKTPMHADSSYNAFNKVRNGALGQYDFYYSLEIVPQFAGKYSDCHSTPGFLDYLRELFGVDTGTLVLVKTDVDFRWTSGSRVSFSNRPAGVKRFQTIHDCGVGVARGLVLLYGIGA